MKAEYQGFPEAPEVAGPGWLWDGQDFTPPPPATAEVLSELAGADTDKKLDAIADMAEALGLNTTISDTITPTTSTSWRTSPDG